MYAQFQVIAFTHSNLAVAEIGLLHIEEEARQARLTAIKTEMGWSELLFLSTCNRVEFFFLGNSCSSKEDLNRFFRSLYSNLAE